MKGETRILSVACGEVGNVVNRLRFDKVTESLKVGTFLRHSVECVVHYVGSLMHAGP